MKDYWQERKKNNNFIQNSWHSKWKQIHKISVYENLELIQKFKHSDGIAVQLAAMALSRRPRNQAFETVSEMMKSFEIRDKKPIYHEECKVQKITTYTHLKNTDKIKYSD